jgi:8-oxo-dGTP pyrophosphatase MutT (NUDIX family)
LGGHSDGDEDMLHVGLKETEEESGLTNIRPYSKEIFKSHGVIDDIISWSKAELIDEWRWQLVDVSTDRRPGRYVFYFDSDRDYCAFLLKWA